MSKEKKSGICDEIPTIKIDKYRIVEMSDNENEFII